MKGKKLDLGKPRWVLMPFNSLTEIVKVLTFGAEKYEDNNWQKVESDRYVSAMLRHFSSWKEGEKKDPESGLHHLAHMGACIVFLLWFELKGKDKK